MALSSGCAAAEQATTAIVKFSLLQFTDQLFDRAIAVDRTRSMSGDKMESARDAARMFVDLSLGNDQLGLLSFKRDSDNGIPGSSRSSCASC